MESGDLVDFCGNEMTELYCDNSQYDSTFDKMADCDNSQENVLHDDVDIQINDGATANFVVVGVESLSSDANSSSCFLLVQNNCFHSTFPGTNGMKLSTIGHDRKKITHYVASTIEVALTMMFPLQLQHKTMIVATLTIYMTLMNPAHPGSTKVQKQMGTKLQITNFFKSTVAPTCKQMHSKTSQPQENTTQAALSYPQQHKHT